MKNKISIVIPSAGSSVVNIQRLLNSIIRQRTSAEVEILLVVNGLETSAVENIKSQLQMPPQLRFISIEKRGVNRARNEGFRQATGEILVYFDDDCELDSPLFLEHHLQYHRQHPGLFAVGGGYQIPSSAGYWDDVYNRLQMRWLYSGRENGPACRHLLGGNFSIKPGFVVKENLSFDENIVYGGSETDFFRQAWAKKLSMELIELDVLHHTRESLASLTRKKFKHGQGKGRMDEKFGDYEDHVRAQDAAVSAGDVVLFNYFNYVFWAGHYYYRGQPLKLVPHLLHDLIKKLNYWRYKILDRF